MNKKLAVILATIILVMAVASISWAEIPTGPNSGPSVPSPDVIGNSGMTTTHSASKPSAPAPQKITIIVNGKEVVSDVAPYITEGRTMVPYRFVAEALGCKVDWDGGTSKVTATKGNNVVWMVIGMKAININGSDKSIDVAPVLKNDRTFVPVRFMSEALGYKVEWNDSTNTVYITG